MHSTQLLLRFIALKFDECQMRTWRIVTNFIASISQLTIIITTIGLYVNSFAPKLNPDKTSYGPSLLPLGAWHMMNVYQYWVFLEIISFFANFFAIMMTLLVASLSHKKVERIMKVPAGLYNIAG